MLRTVILTALAVVLSAGTVQAASYSSLVSDGFRTGPLARNAAGIEGWTVTKGQASYFCRRAAAMAYVGRNGLVSITSAGRQIRLDRKVWEARRGGPDPSLPQLGDLRRGKIRPQDVGACIPASR